jgi:hypothetical protein
VIRPKLRRPSPALVISCIALFVALSGVSYGYATGSIGSREIRNGAITTTDIRNNQVRGRDIRNSTILGRDVAFDTLTGLDIKESKLGKVPSAANADTLGGVGASGFVRSEAPAFTPIPGAGGTAAYDVDGNGYVHLQGTSDGTFTLPAGARPADISRFAVAGGSSPGVLTIDKTGTGTVSGGGGGEASLDGVTFAAGG